METRDRFRGCLLGLGVGDAIGTTVEFCQRGSFIPLTDMVGGGPFSLLPGQWTDDTSMALCLATSLVECQGFDALDQMTRYSKWANEGYLSSTGKCFDIGTTVASAIEKFRQTGDPFAGSTHPRSAGNGCLMRLAPIPMYYFPDIDLIEHYAAQSSRTTHGAEECVDASRLFARIISLALSGETKDRVILASGAKFFGSENIEEISRASYRSKTIADIRGTGYVVESLEAAMWCFDQTENFKDAVLLAANLGDDADTTAAICGQVSGAFYGEANIPGEWLEKLAMRGAITKLADSLLDASSSHYLNNFT